MGRPNTPSLQLSSNLISMQIIETISAMRALERG